MKRIRVVVADDHPLIRAGVTSLVERDLEMRVVGEAADGTAVIALIDQAAPDVVVLDVSMPGQRRTETIAHLKCIRQECKVLALGAHPEMPYVQAMLDAGASGYILKRSAPEELIQAIKTVAEGRMYFDSSLPGFVPELRLDDDGALQTHRRSPELSEREAEVLTLNAWGYSNKEIAASLEVSIKTVETYKKRSMVKLGLRSRVEIVRHALEKGWIAPPPESSRSD